MAFSFGPHIGFWSAYEAIANRGVLVIPGGGMSSIQRLDLCATDPADRSLLHAQLCAAFD